MGKYMKKSKISGDIAVMELSSSTSGVLTRAKTLALKRLLKPSSSPPPQLDDALDASSFCYLQLRSRRLEKPPPAIKQQQHQQQQQKDKRLRMNSNNAASGGGSLSLSCDKKDVEGCCGQNEKPGNDNVNINVNDVGVEASFGENSLDFEPRDRSTRETTPCSLIRGSDTIGTPGSTTRRTNMAAFYHEGRNDMQRIIPTTHEMEEFFACAEQNQQRLFMEKYNFDIVNDMPLPGRYEWVQVVP